MSGVTPNESLLTKSGSAAALIQKYENNHISEIRTEQTPSVENTKSPVNIITDEVPINSELALAKEDLLLNYYFGLPTVSAGDFVNADLDSLLLAQLGHESDLSKCKTYVAAYMSNYTNWASLARMHSHKTQLKVMKFKTDPLVSIYIKWNEHKAKNEHLCIGDPDAVLEVSKAIFDKPADATLTAQIIALSAEKKQIDYVRGHLGLDHNSL